MKKQRREGRGLFSPSLEIMKRKRKAGMEMPVPRRHIRSFAHAHTEILLPSLHVICKSNTHTHIHTQNVPALLEVISNGELPKHAAQRLGGAITFGARKRARNLGS